MGVVICWIYMLEDEEEGILCLIRPALFVARKLPQENNLGAYIDPPYHWMTCRL